MIGAVILTAFVLALFSERYFETPLRRVARRKRTYIDSASIAS